MTHSLAMASAISTSTVSCPMASTSSRPAICALSSSAISHSKTINFHLSSWSSPLDRRLISPWNGLKHLGISTKPKSLRTGKNSHAELWFPGRRAKGKVIYASLFGVGAPEALVIGVVALLVFGPKGLAEVARNLGKTLRAFQPTIKELQEVSNEFKSTLEREIGLDDISSPTQNMYRSNMPNNNTSSNPSSTVDTNNSQVAVDANPNRAYSTEEYLKITEEQLRASSALQQEAQNPPPSEQDAKESAVAEPPPQKPKTET
ncbi:sec-independent protein translocase protein TATB, chloroplastic isoform X2 [Neltuma alba]|uniref:sec-independent protein translocase protein TATB, chloroplastic isoform X2 n=1 Tax=Neltuma alba TaxID=207710 RepID=UPI0010A4AF4C|nr:sec-independent protein translocase protein TATB, chloroplastic isoform X2 [Prosopis alba]